MREEQTQELMKTGRNSMKGVGKSFIVSSWKKIGKRKLRSLVSTREQSFPSGLERDLARKLENLRLRKMMMMELMLPMKMFLMMLKKRKKLKKKRRRKKRKNMRRKKKKKKRRNKILFVLLTIESRLKILQRKLLLTCLICQVLKYFIMKSSHIPDSFERAKLNYCLLNFVNIYLYLISLLNLLKTCLTKYHRT